ncbi:hypothetical protein C8Q80DRAFT_1235064 [Daedaleopsis nitida]|nr:hypothetical protein C8Q80DRAFT_1235064 [Daedaleopsis nitida]
MPGPVENFHELIQPPQWLIDHPALKTRNIDLSEHVGPLKLGCAFYTAHLDCPNYAIKITEPNSEEADIYDKLMSHPMGPPNHTLPCNVIRSDTEKPILIMPFLRDLMSVGQWQWSLGTLLRQFSQILEGVEFLHNAHVAHLDIAVSNLIFAYNQEVAARHEGIKFDKIYIIDFGESRQLDFGPEQQPPIDLPPSQIPKPNGITRLDPYSWDMYCVGRVFRSLAKFTFENRGDSVPRMLTRYISWVIGDEEENRCISVCRCRPTARRAREALAVYQTMVVDRAQLISVTGCSSPS